MFPQHSTKGIVPQKRRVYNEEEATSIAFWIEEVIDDDLEFPEDVLASLRSGVDLCRLVNTLQPGTINEIRMELDQHAYENNLRAYLDACYFTFGMCSYDIFDPCDVGGVVGGGGGGGGDVQRILGNIVALARICVFNNIDVPKLDIDDKCTRSDCSNRIDTLLGEVGSLKRNLKAKEEDNRELRFENDDMRDKIMRQEEYISSMRLSAQTLENTNSELNNSNNTLKDELADVRAQYAQLQAQLLQQQQTQQSHTLATHAEEDETSGSGVDTPRYSTMPTEHPRGFSEGFELKQKKLKKKRVGSYEVKNSSGGVGGEELSQRKLEDMRKFIHKEKKELMKQEKAKRKQDEKQSNAQEEAQGEEPSPPPLSRLTRGLRSITLSKIMRPKDKEKEKEKDKDKTQKDDRPMLETNGVSTSTTSATSTVVVSDKLPRQSSYDNLIGLQQQQQKKKGSFLRRERSFTAAAKMVSPTAPRSPVIT